MVHFFMPVFPIILYAFGATEHGSAGCGDDTGTQEPWWQDRLPGYRPPERGAAADGDLHPNDRCTYLGERSRERDSGAPILPEGGCRQPYFSRGDHPLPRRRDAEEASVGLHTDGSTAMVAGWDWRLPSGDLTPDVTIGACDRLAKT